MTLKTNIFWFRRDLRLEDNTGLSQALKSGLPVLCLFIFDTHILERLENPYDSRISFIHTELKKINSQLHKYKSSLKILTGEPSSVFQELAKSISINSVYVNSDYEQYSCNRDEKIKEFLKSKNIEFYSFKDQVIFEKKEIKKADKSPYTIYTPYMRKWIKEFSPDHTKGCYSEKLLHNLIPTPLSEVPHIKDFGFSPSTVAVPPYNLSPDILSNYKRDREFPALDATTHLGTHLRYGTISIRKAVSIAHSNCKPLLLELIWREFFMQILWNFPYVENNSFKKRYDHIGWRNNEDDFERWCNGTTGYPLVDAGMRQLKITGNMHNRVRMVVANFLCKHLLIDWRWGEVWFASNLLDFDLAANNGNWQWAAGCGCDAAPYFRIFNPTTQQKRFDKKYEYIKKWIPEYDSHKYPTAIVDHAMARERAINTYKKALNKDTL